jgi:transcriptional regulator with XRE-family HTH domain
MQNPPMPSDTEKMSFSIRLRCALDNGAKVKGATALAREFNLQHRAGDGVSVQSAHKWLSGKSIPTADKLATLAHWLNVSPHWLHYGPPPDEAPAAANDASTHNGYSHSGYSHSQESLTLVRKIESLSPRQRLLVEELVMQFHGRPTE